MYMALPDNVTKVFNSAFFEYALVTFNEQCHLPQMVKHLPKMLQLAPTVYQEVIEINCNELIQHIMEAKIHEELKSGECIC